jgi:hypothetical protein
MISHSQDSGPARSRRVEDRMAGLVELSQRGVGLGRFDAKFHSWSPEGVMDLMCFDSSCFDPMKYILDRGTLPRISVSRGHIDMPAPEVIPISQDNGTLGEIYQVGNSTVILDRGAISTQLLVYNASANERRTTFNKLGEILA